MDIGQIGNITKTKQSNDNQNILEGRAIQMDTKKIGMIIGIIIAIIVGLVIIIVPSVVLTKENYSVVTADGTVNSMDTTYENGKYVQKLQYGDKKFDKTLDVTGYLEQNPQKQILPTSVYIDIPQSTQLFPNDDSSVNKLTSAYSDLNTELISKTAQDQQIIANPMSGLDNINQKVYESKDVANVMSEKFQGVSPTLDKNYPTSNNQEQMLDQYKYTDTQVIDTQIQKQVNISNNDIINDIELLNQQTKAKLIPLYDVNEIQQQNRNAMRIQDQQNLTSQTYNSAIIPAPYNPNASILERINYQTNTGRQLDQPSKLISPTIPIGPNIPIQQNIDVAKEAIIQSNDKKETPQVIDITKTEISQDKTPVTNEPKVQINNDKIIIDQKVEPSGNGKQELIETTLTPKAITQVIEEVKKEQYSQLPQEIKSNLTMEQRKAIGELMTVEVLFSFGGLQVPDLSILIQNFPQLKKLFSFDEKQKKQFAKKYNRQSVTKGLQMLNNDLLTNNYNSLDDKVYNGWLKKTIQDTNLGNVDLNNIIAIYKAKYNINPLQKSVTGEVQKDNNGETVITKVDKIVDSEKVPLIKQQSGENIQQQTINQQKSSEPLQKAQNVTAEKQNIESYRSINSYKPKTIKVTEKYRIIVPRLHQQQIQKVKEKYYKI